MIELMTCEGPIRAAIDGGAMMMLRLGRKRGMQMMEAIY